MADQRLTAEQVRSARMGENARLHTGEAFVGGTGSGGTIEDFTALGDVINTAARLAAAARAGEVMASVAGAEAAGLPSGEQRTMHIRGRAEPIEVVVLRHRAREPALEASP
jgi:class 3 adenylate cyclase